MTTHRINRPRGTLYRSKSYRRTSLRLWLALVVPFVALLGVAMLVVAYLMQTGRVSADVPFSSLAIGSLQLAMLGGSLPSGYCGHRPGRDPLMRPGRTH